MLHTSRLIARLLVSPRRRQSIVNAALTARHSKHQRLDASLFCSIKRFYSSDDRPQDKPSEWKYKTLGEIPIVQLNMKGTQAHADGNKELAIDYYTQALNLPVTEPMLLPIVHLIRFSRAVVMAQVGSDPKAIASELKIYLDNVKDNDKAWDLYFGAKLTSMLQESTNDDLLELKGMVTEALQHVQDTEIRTLGKTAVTFDMLWPIKLLFVQSG